MTEHEDRSPRFSHFVWLAPLLAVTAFFSYYTFFVKWAVFRDTAWLNIGVLLAALVMSVLGLSSVWKNGALARALAVGSVLVSGTLAGVLIAYCYVLSYGLPSADAVVAAGERVPPLMLVSDTGESIDLAPAGESVILVFYRGFW